ncbi:hypothetical protein UMZ34_06910 [Halopseudomonas pachastrellae]|nr:hypothetical protein UMZ34_06910 [Halopseudomonas pachastrellae]
MQALTLPALQALPAALRPQQLQLQLTPQAGQRLQADTLLKADLQAEGGCPKRPP